MYPSKHERMLNIKTFEVNMLPVNTYVVWDETKEAVVIDCGCYYDTEKEEFKRFIQDNDLRIVRLLDTHLHFDHIFGNPFMWKEFGIKAEAHQADQPWLDHVTERIRSFGIRECDTPVPLKGYLDEGDEVHFGNHTFTLFHIPGHSLGSLCFYCREENVLFTGDVLFRFSIGRTDLGGGGEEMLIRGIREKLLPLPDNTRIYSGHGPVSTIGDEKKYNVYLR